MEYFWLIILKKEVMKKMLAGLTVMLMSCALCFTASAQNGGGGGDRMAQMRQSLKDSIGLSDTQIDSVMAVQQDLRPQRRAIFQDQSLSQDDRQAKMKALNDAAAARYKNFLTADQIAKLQAYQQRQMDRMRQRQGGGGGGN
jgi:hypothetical protein